jgi:hypothetical protein
MRNTSVALVMTLGLLQTGCKNLTPANEQYREEPNKTVYRAADEETREEPATVAPQQKIPGQ